MIFDNSKDNKFTKYGFKGVHTSDYLKSLTDFAEILGSIDKADEAAKELLADAEKTDALAADAPKTQAEESPDTPDLSELLAELDELVGLDEIKQNVKSLINLVKVRKLREEHGLRVPPISLHMVFLGNPGTGKTTVARLLAGIYRAIGVLSKGHLIETDRSGLVAGYVGQTALKTTEVIKKAMGGILFIDEAYSLTEKEGNDFGDEAIETLLKAMEDHRDDFIVIVAGYTDLMQRFIDSNPGLQSRFNRYYAFADYTGEELYQIFMVQCKKNEYELNEEADAKLRDYMNALYESRDANFGNGRDVRNFFEDIISVQSDRVALMEAPEKEDLIRITADDVEKAKGL